MKNDYIRMFITIVVVSVIMVLIMKIDDNEVEYKTTTKKYEVCKKVVEDKKTKSYSIKCIDSNNEIYTLYIEDISNVSNINTTDFYNYIKEGKFYEFTTVNYRKPYSGFPKMYITGFAEVDDKRKDGK